MPGYAKAFPRASAMVTRSARSVRTSGRLMIKSYRVAAVSGCHHAVESGVDGRSARQAGGPRLDRWAPRDRARGDGPRRRAAPRARR